MKPCLASVYRSNRKIQLQVSSRRLYMLSLTLSAALTLYKRKINKSATKPHLLKACFKALNILVCLFYQPLGSRIQLIVII